MPIDRVGTDEAARSPGRGDVEVSGLDHGGASYELRIFLDNPRADASTPTTVEQGYAASIHVYGYGGSGDESSRNALTRSVIATSALSAAAARGEVSAVTLVPVAYEGGAAAIDLSAASVALFVA